VKDPLLFDEQAQGRQRVQKHLGRARVGAQPGGHFHRAGAVPHGRKQVEFQRREDDTALLKPPDALAQVVGEHAGGFPGAARGQHLFAIVQDLRAHSRGIGAYQPLDGRTLLEMRAHDLRHVRRGHARVPDALGINHQVRPVLAQAQRAARRHLDCVYQPARPDFAPQRLQHLIRAPRRAARHSFGLLLVADKHVKPERRHISSPVSR
jgi:hypothetical protein